MGTSGEKRENNVVLQLSKIVGTAGEKTWSQIHTFTPSDPEKISRRGQLLAVVSLDEFQEKVEVVAAGREVISRLHEEYYGELGPSPLVQLKKAVKKIRAEVGLEAVLEIATAAVVDSTLYAVVLGNGELILRRDGKMAPVLAGEGAVSGCLQGGDFFLLGTGKIFAVLAEDKLRLALALGSPEKAAESLLPAIYAQEQSGAVAGLLVQVEKKETVKSRPESPKKSFISHLKTRAFWCWGKIRRAKIYLTQEPAVGHRSQKTLISVALILLLILAVSLFWGAKQRKHLARQKQIDEMLEQARSKKEEGESLLELNPLQAKELLLEAQKLLETISPSNGDNQAVAEFKQELETILPKVLREYQVEPQLFFDLELIRQGARADDLAFSGKQLVFLDRGEKAVYSLGVDDRQSAILAGGPKLEGAVQVAAFWPQIFIFTGEGIVKANGEKKGQNLLAETKAEGEAVDFQAFGGNLYLLDKTGIGKYSAIEGGFGQRQAWLKDEVEFDFSQAVSMAIDGSIWILTAEGKILKYVQGREVAFGIAGLDKPFSRPRSLYADAELESLYILDGGNSRVVVLGKSGEYEAEYRWPDEIKVSQIAVSEEEGKIWLVGGSKVYEIEIR